MISIDCLVVRQPIGEFYIASMSIQDLRKICYFDVRTNFGDEYLGIQRQLNPKRVDEIRKYVTGTDATFPTSIVLAVDENCATVDDNDNETFKRVHLAPFEGDSDLGLDPVPEGRIARVIDGQHRIAGLDGFDHSFDLSVSLFIGADPSDQANVFSTVNLAQTKVNKSLVYDLFELAKAKSPQKTAHNVAVALDRDEKGPFYRRIKRLGVATAGRDNETITQATFVNALIPLISKDPEGDRRLYRWGKIPASPSAIELAKVPFRDLFLAGRDIDIATIIRNYFMAVRQQWPRAWNEVRPGHILNRTNGYRALMRMLPPIYNRLRQTDAAPAVEQFSQYLGRVDVADDYFSKENFEPGTGGEARLVRFLRESIFGGAVV